MTDVKKTKEEIADYLVTKAKPNMINLVNLGELRTWSNRKCSLKFLQALIEQIESKPGLVITGFIPLVWEDLSQGFKLTDDAAFIGIVKDGDIDTLDLSDDEVKPNVKYALSDLSSVSDDKKLDLDNNTCCDFLERFLEKVGINVELKAPWKRWVEFSPHSKKTAKEVADDIEMNDPLFLSTLHDFAKEEGVLVVVTDINDLDIEKEFTRYISYTMPDGTYAEVSIDTWECALQLIEHLAPK